MQSRIIAPCSEENSTAAFARYREESNATTFA